MEGKNEESTKLRKLSNRDACNKEKRRRPTILNCAFCGALLELQPSPYIMEEGNKFCNRNHAYEHRLGKESIEKQTQMGGI